MDEHVIKHDKKPRKSVSEKKKKQIKDEYLKKDNTQICKYTTSKMRTIKKKRMKKKKTLRISQ